MSSEPAPTETTSDAETSADPPHVARASLTPANLLRLGALSVGTAVMIFLISTAAVAVFPKGTVLDVVVLVMWLGAVVTSIGGVLLVAAAGITKLVQARAGTVSASDPA